MTVTNSAVLPEPAFGPVTATRRGFLHGPASNTSSAALPDSVLQMVTPIQVGLDTENVQGPKGSVGYIGTLTIRFVPEPGRLLLLVSGAFGLVLLSWRRGRR